ANYKVETITVKQGSTDVPTNAGTAGTYTFSMPSGDVTVNATIVQLYTITVPATTNGTVTAKVGGVEATQALSGETITLTITPGTGYKLDALSVKDASNADVATTAVTAGTSYTFTMPSGDVSVSATFKAPYGSKAAPDAVGDIVFSDGSAEAYSEGLTLTTEQKAAAVGVVAYLGSASAGQAGKVHVLGLSYLEEKFFYYEANGTTSSTLPPELQSLLGQTDGLANRTALNQYAETNNINMSVQFPEFYFANNYNMNGISDNWYIPSFQEMSAMFSNRIVINNALGKVTSWSFNDIASGTNQMVFSSSLQSANAIYEFGMNYANGTYGGPRDYTCETIVVRAF
ncbi:MAG: hypothetical protein II921_00970, partial [Treponema sp.]|nr:hypothetical protein [Treponema sp.]